MISEQGSEGGETCEYLEIEYLGKRKSRQWESASLEEQWQEGGGCGASQRGGWDIGASLLLLLGGREGGGKSLESS